jgi:hypothetical protein
MLVSDTKAPPQAGSSFKVVGRVSGCSIARLGPGKIRPYLLW